MKNKEFYKDEIYEVACKRDVFAVNKKTGEVMRCACAKCYDCVFDNHRKFRTCTDCNERAMAWLEQEHIEPLLKDKEKRYIENVIRPFKNRVKGVVKNKTTTGYEYLNFIVVSLDKTRTDSFGLPLFNCNTAYLGMELGKWYMPEKLGLFADEEEK